MSRAGAGQMLIRGGICIEEIAEIKRTLKIGDIVKYRMAVFTKTPKDYRYAEHKVDAEVVAKYPHIVEVVPVRDKRGLPIKTVTYTEIAMERRKQANKKENE